MAKSARRGSRSVTRTAFDDACRSLSRRRLTEGEVRIRLARRHNPTEIDDAILKLKEYRFLDDQALIVDFARDRLNFSPRSARMIEFELSRRGIDPDDFRQVFEAEFPEYDEIEVARRALKTRLKKLISSPQQGRRERALRFLNSRGFSYDVMNEVWDEAQRNNDFREEFENPANDS